MEVPSQFCIYFMCIFTMVTAVNIQIISETHVLDQGPVVQIKCIYNLTFGTAYTYTWVHQNQTMAINGTLHQADPSRYSVHFFQPEFKGSILQIENALQTDKGEYQCIIDYTVNGVPQTQMLVTDVTITDYLPPNDFPKCTIEPSLTLVSILTDVTFKCEPGESSKPLVLDLKLIRQDMHIRQFGQQTITTIVTNLDDGAVFECHMTSTQFPFVRRNCTAGPIRVVDSIDNLPTTTIASTKPSSTKPSLSTSESTSAPSNMPQSGSSENSLIWIIIGAAFGSVIIILLVVLTICRFQQLHKIDKAKKSALEFSSHSPSVMDNSLVLKNPAVDDTDTKSQSKPYKPHQTNDTESKSSKNDTGSQSPTYTSNEMDDAESHTPAYASYHTDDNVKLRFASIMENNINKPRGHLGEIEKES